jgi:hypothetical protein
MTHRCLSRPVRMEGPTPCRPCSGPWLCPDLASISPIPRRHVPSDRPPVRPVHHSPSSGATLIHRPGATSTPKDREQSCVGSPGLPLPRLYMTIYEMPREGSRPNARPTGTPRSPPYSICVARSGPFDAYGRADTLWSASRNRPSTRAALVCWKGHRQKPLDPATKNLSSNPAFPVPHTVLVTATGDKPHSTRISPH